MRILLWTTVALVGLPFGTDVRAADPDARHPHQGIVEPFRGQPAAVPLDDVQIRALARGETILVTVQGDHGGRGTAVQDIRATPETIWDRIAAFRDYPGMVAHVAECEPYRKEGNDIRVRFVLKLLGLRYEYYIRHDFRPELGYMTWTLDYSRESDLDDSVGYWAVQSLPGDPQRSRLFYSVDMRTRGWMPGFIRRMIARQGLEEATGWVKREAEALERRRIDERADGAPASRD